MSSGNPIRKFYSSTTTAPTPGSSGVGEPEVTKYFRQHNPYDPFNPVKTWSRKSSSSEVPSMSTTTLSSPVNQFPQAGITSSFSERALDPNASEFQPKGESTLIKAPVTTSRSASLFDINSGSDNPWGPAPLPSFLENRRNGRQPDPPTQKNTADERESPLLPADIKSFPHLPVSIRRDETNVTTFSRKPERPRLPMPSTSKQQHLNAAANLVARTKPQQLTTSPTAMIHSTTVINLAAAEQTSAAIATPTIILSPECEIIESYRKSLEAIKQHLATKNIALPIMERLLKKIRQVKTELAKLNSKYNDNSTKEFLLLQQTKDLATHVYQLASDKKDRLESRDTKPELPGQSPKTIPKEMISTHSRSSDRSGKNIPEAPEQVAPAKSIPNRPTTAIAEDPLQESPKNIAAIISLDLEQIPHYPRNETSTLSSTRISSQDQPNLRNVLLATLGRYTPNLSNLLSFATIKIAINYLGFGIIGICAINTGITLGKAKREGSNEEDKKLLVGYVTIQIIAICIIFWIDKKNSAPAEKSTKPISISSSNSTTASKEEHIPTKEDKALSPKEEIRQKIIKAISQTRKNRRK